MLLQCFWITDSINIVVDSQYQRSGRLRHIDLL